MQIRRNQPQGLLRIQPGGPFATGLRLAALPGVNRVFDAAGSGIMTPTGIKLVGALTGVAGGFGSTLGVGTTDKIVTKLSGAYPASGRTYFFRALRRANGGGGLGRLFDKTSGSTGQLLYVGASGLTYSEYFSGAERVLSTTAPAAGAWFEVLVTTFYNGSTRSAYMYVNGILATNETATVGSTQNDAPTTPISIGNRASDNARNWDGLIQCAYVWDRLLTTDEAQALSANPWQVFQSSRPLRVIVSGVAGTASWSEADDTTAANGALSVSGSSATTEANDSSSATGSVAVSAGSATAEEADATAASATVTVSGAASVVEGDDTAAASGTVGNVVNGQAAWAEQSDTTAAAATATVSTTASWLEQSDLTDASGAQTVTGSAAWSELNDITAIVAHNGNAIVLQPNPRNIYYGIPRVRTYTGMPRVRSM